MIEWDLLVDGVDFGEGPRWHDGRLWYSDFYQAAIYSVGPSGDRRVEHGDLPDRPSGLGWLPDGDLLAVLMTQRRIVRFDERRAMHPHADLSEIATGYCNDMVVAADGTAYVGNFGFDLEARSQFQPATLAHVAPDGTAGPAATDMRFPNGSVITPDGSTLIVAQTFGGDFVAFDIGSDGSLSGRRTWASVPGTSPDGCALDTGGALWFADAVGSQLLRVREGGEVTDVFATPQPAFACALGGDDGRTLFAMCAPGPDPGDVAGRRAGAIYQRPVDLARAGLP